MSRITMNADDMLLQEIEQTCQQLLARLQQEYDSLSRRDYQALLEISQHKQSLIDSLTALDTQVSSKAGMKQHPRWPSTRNLIQQCQQQNASNGKLLARSYQLSKEALGILTGQDKTSNTTYNSSGIQQSATAALANVTA